MPKRLKMEKLLPFPLERPKSRRVRAADADPVPAGAGKRWASGYTSTGELREHDDARRLIESIHPKAGTLAVHTPPSTMGWHASAPADRNDDPPTAEENAAAAANWGEDWYTQKGEWQGILRLNFIKFAVALDNSVKPQGLFPDPPSANEWWRTQAMARPGISAKSPRFFGGLVKPTAAKLTRSVLKVQEASGGLRAGETAFLLDAPPALKHPVEARLNADHTAVWDEGKVFVRQTLIYREETGGYASHVEQHQTTLWWELPSAFGQLLPVIYPGYLLPSAPEALAGPHPSKTDQLPPKLAKLLRDGLDVPACDDPKAHGHAVEVLPQTVKLTDETVISGLTRQREVSWRVAPFLDGIAFSDDRTVRAEFQQRVHLVGGRYYIEERRAPANPMQWESMSPPFNAQVDRRVMLWTR